MKTKMSHRIFALVLVLCTLLTLFPVYIFAAEEAESGTDEDVYADIFKELDAEFTDVQTAEELETALATDISVIRVTADFALDRTFFVTHDVAIYASEKHTLTRAADFAADIFVVGEAEDGTLSENEVTLTLGNPANEENDLLVIDGNAAAMTVDVVGSVLFITKSGIVDVFANTTLQNHKKVGNAKTSGDYGVSYPVRVGGAVAIIAASAEMNIYGGKFLSNSVNEVADDENTSVQGGAIYNFGVLNIYGGTFDSNKALLGGAFYNYRTMHIYRAVISNNVAASHGGAVYMPNSTGAYTYLGEDNPIAESAVSFKGNTSGGSGGAIYARNLLSIKSTVFSENDAVGVGGAIAAYTVRMTVADSAFSANTSTSHGGAIYLADANGKEDVLELTAQNTLFSENTSTKYGGALYLSNARMYLEGCDLISNSGSYAGAIYATGSTLEINEASVSGNTATANGGAIALYESSAAVLNKVSATENSSSGGGFIYSNASNLTIYNSTIVKNTSTKASGALALYESAVTKVYGTSFEENTAGTNAGAITAYTGGTELLLHSCSFTGNTSANYGGALHVSGKSIVNAYSITAKDNEALYGGFMYETAAGTVVTLGGLTVSSNTAENGPIIWGNTLNADLYIDKYKYLDLDNLGDWDDAYWATVIQNKLTVVPTTVNVPTYTDYDNTVITPVVPIVPSDVTTAAELERALNAGLSEIFIAADITVDRTFFITYNVTIRAKEAHKLIRAADFAGDIFVIGEASDGTACESEVILTLGDSEATATDLLTIDGNTDAMTVSVVGSALFVVGGSRLDVYKDVTVSNHKKVGNERTNGDYGVSYPVRVGGSAAIVANDACMNIYGATFKNNSVNLTADSESTSVQGGAIYNFGILSVYGGLFENNSAYFGGVFFNYRKLYIYSADIVNNTSASHGGTIYMPNSTGAFLYIGEENDVTAGEVTFRGNTANGYGGAIYARNFVSVKNATFSGNKASASSGGAITATTTRMTVENSFFVNNEAAKHGGAIYLTDENGREEKELTAINTVFRGNTAVTYGGAIYAANGAEAMLRDVSFYENSGGYGGAIFLNASHMEINGSTMSENIAKTNGGAVEIYETATALFNDITASKNSAVAGGFLYSDNATLSLYNSQISENSATKASGAIAFMTDSVGKVYATSFEENTAGTNAGAITAYTGGTEVMLHSCSFTGNGAANFGGAMHVSGKTVLTAYNLTATDNEALYGGFMYETAATTVVTIGGLTLSGNTAPNGPIIWGNTLNATLYLDKSKYTDLDHTGSYDSTYFASAIVNKLTVSDASVDVPKYLDYGNESYEHMKDAIDVSNADELEAAIKNGAKYIRVVADFTLDRTFYITREVVIFSTIERTLTRDESFGGDIFVIGENENGKSALLLGQDAKLTLGNPLSVKENLLTIDGNAASMKVDVVGSVLFISYSATVELYDNVTVKNCNKVGNERVYDEKYLLASANRIGGSVAIVANGTLNIYGGSYIGNRVNDDVADLGEDGKISTNGGAIFNRSNLSIYGGTFEGNHGARGVFAYNYAVTRIYGGLFIANTSSAGGAVFYCPSVASCRLLIGSGVSGAQTVVFKGNTAKTHGGVIYTSAQNAVVIYGNTEFVGNTAHGSGGAICAYGQLTVKNAIFRENVADTRGGAVYISDGTSIEDFTRYVLFEGCTFEKNQATHGGALQVFASSADVESGSIVFVKDCAFTENRAMPPEGSTASAFGGAINVDRKSSLTVSDSVFTANTSEGEAGAIHVAGMATVTVTDTVIEDSYAKDKGGAFSVRSSTLTLSGVTVSGSTAESNGGAIYVAYSSAYDVNSTVNMTDCTVSGNTSGSFGGAIYATRHAVTNETQILTLRGVDFLQNTAAKGAGAVYLASLVKAYMKDVSFVENTATASEGGAIYAAGAILEIDTASFSANKAQADKGGAIAIVNGATVTLNAITASENTSCSAGGFMYAEDCTLMIYNSTLKQNASEANAGAIALYGGANTDIYNTVFEGNVSGANGGALTVYTSGAEVILHSCTLKGNSAVYGGGIYTSGESILKIYSVTAKENSATRGGFLYETTTGTEVTLNGATVSGNTASDGGAIIWGNSTGAVLHINKTNYVDENASTLDEAYFATAIYNKLTVKEITATVPSHKDYSAKADPTTPKTPTKAGIPVEVIFELAKKSSDGYISSTYEKFPVLDKSSNFMSKGQTIFEDIDGQTVTVDSFVYPEYGRADNVSVGEGLLIYQAMLYKKAHPEENVSIDISSYRFSVQAAVNINRDSRYFGYMRQLSGVEYDEFGFVRIAYLLICAAKMGINVTVIGQTDAYPMSAGEQTLYNYFNSRLTELCDPSYENGKTVGDFLNFAYCYWTLDTKGGTDMMHTKLCAVSHYLDMNGTAHQNAVWTSSANLDGIYNAGYNANWKLQTATIVSDHEALYRTSVNYLRLLATYCGQEEIYEFQDLVNLKTTEQAKLILGGRASEIPAGEQLIYLGTEGDDVFELYFAPFGGSVLAWDEVQNPYCKYIRKMYNSEDYIVFAWNAAEYNGNFPLGKQLEEMIIASFHENRNPNNKIYGIMESFDATSFDDLTVGVDIGFKSFNTNYFGVVHNKDIHLSYVENGQRYYVSILNSMNVHSGSMYYQSNFALVIKEKTCSEDSVYATVTRHSVGCDMITHTYSEELLTEPCNETAHGRIYKVCTVCGHELTVKTLHNASEWITLKEATLNEDGVRYKKCTICDKILYTEECAAEKTEALLSTITGATFTQNILNPLEKNLAKSPKTFEAIVLVPKNVKNRGGIIFSNNGSSKDIISFEIFTGGRVRIFAQQDGFRNDCVFDTDIRGSVPKHIAVTVDGTTAMLYVDGVLTETKTIAKPFPASTDGYFVGGDGRKGNTEYFKGTLYSLSLFSDIRSASEIKADAVRVPKNTADLLFTQVYGEEEKQDAKESGALPGILFTGTAPYALDTALQGTPKTIEALISVPKSITDRAGTVIGSYHGFEESQNIINLEVYSGGRVRLFYITNGVREDCIFQTDIRSSEPVHVAVAVDGLTALLYVNGTLAERRTLKIPLPEATDGYVIGGDRRPGNAQSFKGKLYAVDLFDSVRSAQEIESDKNAVGKASSTLYSTPFHALYNVKGGDTLIGSDTLSSMTFTDKKLHTVGTLNGSPKTFEATVCLPESFEARAGVIISNYGLDANNAISIEIYTGGRVRLFYITNGTRTDCIFETDIRASRPVHIAVTVEDLLASLYVDGKLAEEKAVNLPLPEVSEGFAIGGDQRSGNLQYFKGTVYAVNLFADVRTASEVAGDAVAVNAKSHALLYSAYVAEDGTFCTINGQSFASNLYAKPSCTLPSSPHTFEAILSLPRSHNGRGGIIIGNNSSEAEIINFEIYTMGRVRLYFVKNGVTTDCVFSTDVRTDGPVHIALSVDGTKASLYLNGACVETQTLPDTLPTAQNNYYVGADGRIGNNQYFKGTLYAVNLFADARSAEEIRTDMFTVANAEDLIYSGYFVKENAQKLSLYDIHIAGDALSDREATQGENGVWHVSCLDCGKLISVGEHSLESNSTLRYDHTLDNGLAEGTAEKLTSPLSATAKTYEFTVQLSPLNNLRAGVLLGNYDGTAKDQLNLEIYTNGNPRLYYKVGGVAYTHLFTTDIRSDEPVHLAFVFEGLELRLYVNGVLTETATLSVPLPEIKDSICIGTDNRTVEPMIFSGRIYSINLFDNVRSEEEIKKDIIWVAEKTNGLIYSNSFLQK